jgi:2-polyprenyl-3-methyl-5-hydroxy-6-metoxy-1,4-benzoquinol methylase
MSLAACRVCGGKDVALHTRYRALPIYIWPLPEGQTHEREDAELHVCADCGHMQLQDFPPEFFPKLYAHEAFNLEDQEEHARRAAAMGKDFFKGKKVLDVGGGVNSFAATLKGAEAWVCDFSISPEVRKSVAKAVEGDIATAALPAGYFDVVCFTHCIEHLNSPAAVIEKCAGLLKKDGIIFVEVPNAPEVIARMPYYAVFHQHVNLFSIEALDWLFSKKFKRQQLLRSDNVILAAYSHGSAKPASSKGKQYADLLNKKLGELEASLRALPLDANPSHVALRGAGGSATLLLAHFPWLAQKISHCYDQDSRKQGRRLPGTTLTIEPPEKIDSQVKQMLYIAPTVRIEKL